jgi:hypothetical protein
MISRLNQLLLLLASLLLAADLGGCASLNEKASAAMGDYVPRWAGGLPADAPPRPGTAKYDEWMKEREQQRLLPADQRTNANNAQASTSQPAASKPASNANASGQSTGSTPSSLDPVH